MIRCHPFIHRTQCIQMSRICLSSFLRNVQCILTQYNDYLLLDMKTIENPLFDFLKTENRNILIVVKSETGDTWMECHDLNLTSNLQ
jgi:hypothetical protein